MRFCSFGRSFLWPHGVARCSARRWRAAVAAARLRWPDGFVEVDRPARQARFMVPNVEFPDKGALCGLLLCW